MFEVESREELSDSQIEDAFDEFLDNTNEEVVIAGITFSPSDILKECDPIAYRCELSNFESFMIDNGDWEEEEEEEEGEEEEEEA